MNKYICIYVSKSTPLPRNIFLLHETKYGLASIPLGPHHLDHKSFQ